MPKVRIVAVHEQDMFFGDFNRGRFAGKRYEARLSPSEVSGWKEGWVNVGKHEIYFFAVKVAPCPS